MLRRWKSLAHGYRTLQHWNQWLSQDPLGLNLLQAEHNLLKSWFERSFGKHAILLGVPHQSNLLALTPLPFKTLVSPLVSHDKHYLFIESEFNELPLHSGSVDFVLLPHILELVDNPRRLFTEACRVLKPEGLIVICGFNPLSTWGLKKWLSKKKHTPWTGTFIPAHEIKKWLGLAEFELEKQKMILYRPPLSNKDFFSKLKFIEHIGSRCLPSFGGVYVMVARAKVIPLTPIRWKWKQRLSDIRISTTITGHIARFIQ